MKSVKLLTTIIVPGKIRRSAHRFCVKGCRFYRCVEMPESCSGYNCTERFRSGSGITFHRFPFRDPVLLSTWVRATRRDNWQPSKYSVLCSQHFEEKCFYFVNGKKRLLNQAVPSIFDFPVHLKKAPTKERASRRRVRAPEVAVGQASNNTPSLHLSTSSVSLTDHQYSLPSPRKMKRKLEATIEKCTRIVKKQKIQFQQVRRQKGKIRKMENIVQELKSRICSQGAMIIESSFSEVLKDLLENQVPHKTDYSKNIKQFALTLHFYSAKAYDYLRTILKLPHPSTLRRWATSLEGKPGFTEQSFLQIAEEVKLLQQKPDNSGNPGRLFCCLIMDEMSIKKQVDFDGQEIVGYCDLGHGCISDDNLPVATHALVFMITAVNGNWKMPLGYCLVDGLDGSTRANLAKLYLQKLYDVGAECVALTCDGTACNISMFTELGVQLNAKPLKNWFIHPSDPDRKVYSILDAAHMIKLTRNLIGEKGIIIDSSKPEETGKVEWRFFKNLNVLQEQEGIHAANKLRIMFQKQKMKVGLAAQTLSRSVSSAIKFCEDLKVDGFKGAAATAEFASKIDDIFDLLNSCHIFGKRSKSPIVKANKDVILKRIDDGIKYLQGLKEQGIEGKYIIESRRKTGVLGFITDLMSIKDLSEELVWNESAPLKGLLTKKFSQDHLELFFGSIRKRTGDNNNPSALQFRWAYRKCLLARISPPTKGNCKVDNTELLQVSSSSSSIGIPRSTQFDTDHSYILEYEPLTVFAASVIEYISGFVAKIFSQKSKCPSCIRLVFGSDKHRLIKSRDFGALVAPSSDLIKLCQYGEHVFRGLSLNNMHGSNWLLKLQCEVMRQVSVMNIFKHDHLFLDAPLGTEQHYSVLVKTCLAIFFKLRLKHKCKEMSTQERGLIVRQELTKLILFKGQ